MVDRHKILVEDAPGENSIAVDELDQEKNIDYLQNPKQLIEVEKSHRRDSVVSSESKHSEEPEIDISTVSKTSQTLYAK